MQCREFNQLLPLLLKGTLAPDLRNTCELHMDACSGCVEVFAAASAAVFVTPDASDIFRSIVQATIPELCATSADLLFESLDDSLNEPQSLLLARHLQDCVNCQQLHGNLRAMDRELHLLAELQPPEALLGQILRAISGTFSPPMNHQHQWLERIRRVLLRPRFALEASFVATLLWSLLFGIPATVLDTAIAEQPAMIERLELAQFWTQTQSGLEREIAELGPELSAPVAALENIFLSLAENVQRRGNILRYDLADWIDTLVAGLLPGQP